MRWGPWLLVLAALIGCTWIAVAVIDQDNDPTPNTVVRVPHPPRAPTVASTPATPERPGRPVSTRPAGPPATVPTTARVEHPPIRSTTITRTRPAPAPSTRTTTTTAPAPSTTAPRGVTSVVASLCRRLHLPRALC